MNDSYLYVISAAGSDAGPCKLGISTDPDRRLRSLQTAHPERLEVRHREPVEPDKSRALERLLHRDINYKRVRGEWFDLSVAEATAHVQFTIIHYGEVSDLVRKVRSRRV